MSAWHKARRALPYALGAVTALAGAKLFAPRVRPAEDMFSERTGRGAPETPPDAASVAAGYETGDADARRIWQTVAVFGAAILAGVGLMMLMLGVLHRQDHARVAGLTDIQRSHEEPPLPHLQADPIGELAALRAREAALLHGYALLDDGKARIPIDRAMALVVGQSLDAHATPEPAVKGRTP